MRILFLILVTISSTSHAESIHIKTKSQAELQATIRAATVEAEQESDIETHREEEFIVDYAAKESDDVNEEDYYIEEEYVEPTEESAREEDLAQGHAESSTQKNIDTNFDVETENIGFLPVPENEKTREMYEEEIEPVLDSNEDYDSADTTPYEQLEKIDTKQSIESYIDELLAKDPEVLHVSITEGIIDFEYINSAKILGVFPIQFKYKVVVEDDSTFSIEEPWWLMFVSDSLAIFKRELRTALSTIPDETETEDRQRQTLRLMGTVSQMVQKTKD